MDGADRAQVENALAELKRAIEAGRSEEIKTATENLNRIWGEVSGRLYGRSRSGGTGRSGRRSGSGAGRRRAGRAAVGQEGRRRRRGGRGLRGGEVNVHLTR